MIGIVGNFLKIILVCAYALILLPNVALASWLWPKRKNIECRYKRFAFSTILMPVVAIAATSAKFEELFNGMTKF
ncbi:MAG: hypothetical protein U9M92_00585 [Patescibacteria group bacterium]|nr:hypothetical protein [Patescibacteria group bacterium]